MDLTGSGLQPGSNEASTSLTHGLGRELHCALKHADSAKGLAGNIWTCDGLRMQMRWAKGASSIAQYFAAYCLSMPQFSNAPSCMHCQCAPPGLVTDTVTDIHMRHVPRITSTNNRCLEP